MADADLYGSSSTGPLSQGSLGRKVFFLHPQAFVQNQVVAELAQEEFEVYVVKDEVKLRQILRKYPDSIVFASINEALKENVWEEWIRGIMSNPETKGVSIGVLASVASDELKQKYTEEIKVHCGYTQVKSDLQVILKTLNAILNSVNAKGRRKFLRALMEKETNTTVNIPVGGSYVNGIIKDISVVGFSCTFPDDPELTKNALFPDIQIRLQTQLLKVEGIVFGSRMDGQEKVYVVIFTQRVDPSMKSRIRKYIQTTLQSRMDNEIK